MMTNGSYLMLLLLVLHSFFVQFSFVPYANGIHIYHVDLFRGFFIISPFGLNLWKVYVESLLGGDVPAGKRSFVSPVMAAQRIRADMQVLSAARWKP